MERGEGHGCVGGKDLSWYRLLRGIFLSTYFGKVEDIPLIFMTVQYIYEASSRKDLERGEGHGCVGGKDLYWNKPLRGIFSQNNLGK